MSLLVQLAAREIPLLHCTLPSRVDANTLSYVELKRLISEWETLTTSTFCGSTCFGQDNDNDDKDK